MAETGLTARPGGPLRGRVRAPGDKSISHRYAMLASLAEGHGEPRIVFAGDRIAFQGTITEGEGTIVPASPESDFEPHYVRACDLVSAGSLLTEGKLYIRNE